MTVAELVCEFLYAGKTLREVAGYDDIIMRHVLCRPRDDSGKLVHRDPDLPSWVTTDSKGQWVLRNPKSYTAMLHDLMKKRGIEGEQKKLAFAEWRSENPGYGIGGE